MYDYILQFDDSVKAIEQEKGELAAAKYLYQKWKQEPASLNRLLCALTETWLALLDIDEDYDDTRQPFAANSGLEEYEAILSETALYGRAHFPENATFLAYLSHMSGVIPYYFFALWDRQCSYEAWTDEMIALGERACQLQPENLFARAVCRWKPGSPAHAESCKVFWAANDAQDWLEGNAPSYFYYLLDGDIYAGTEK